LRDERAFEIVFLAGQQRSDMPSHLPTAVLNVALGGLLLALGAVVVRHPETSYHLRAGWRHDGDVSLSEKGRTDMRVAGGVIVLIGMVILARGMSFL
jgi:uncharacterized protein YjeT (DUF2065 family)